MNRKIKIFLIFSLVSVLILGVVSIATAGSGGSIQGGGQLREKAEGSDSSEQYKISFGGWVQGVPGNYTGEWEVNFHNVGNVDFDKSKFYTNDIRAVNYYKGNSSSCNAAFNFTAYGKWNNKSGYKIIFRGGDAGSPGKDDTVRVELYNPNGTKVYDTHSNNEFSDESNCVGNQRTGLDKGNLTVVLP